MDQKVNENVDTNAQNQEAEIILNKYNKPLATIYMETVAALKIKANGNDILTFDI